MNIIKCAKCGSKFDASIFHPGKKFRCGKCMNIIEIPAESRQPGEQSGSEPATTPLPNMSNLIEQTSPARQSPSKPVIEPIKTPSRPELEPINPPADLISFDDKPSAPTQMKATAVPPQPPQMPKPQPNPRPQIQPKLQPQMKSHLPAQTPGPPQAKKNLVTSRRSKGSINASTEKLPQKPLTQGQKMKRILIGSTIAAAVIALALFLIFYSKNDIKQPPKRMDSHSINDQYKSKLVEIGYEKDIKPLIAKASAIYVIEKRTPSRETAKLLYQVANWCKENNLQENYEQHITESVLLNPALLDEMKSSIAAIYENKKNASMSTPDDLYKLAQWCARVGLKDEAITQLLKANTLKQDRDDVKILLTELDMVNIGDNKVEWVTKKDYYDFIKRDKRIGQVNHFKDTFKLFPDPVKSSDPNEPEFAELDKSPFYLCITRSQKFNEQLILEDFSEKLFTFYEEFKKMYGPVLDIESMNQEVLAVYIFESRDLYMAYGQFARLNLPVNAMGHFDPAEGWLMFPADFDDPYRIIFHEGTHQLIHTITQSKLRERAAENQKFDNMFWFTEGIATFFESFRRDPSGKIVQGTGIINKERALNIQAALAVGQYVALSDFLQKEYGEFMGEVLNPQRDEQTRAKIGSLYYAQAWSFVYFLHNYNNGEYMNKFNEYFKEEVNGLGGYKTFQRIFGNVRDLEDKWVKFTKELKIQ